ncbi:MAG: rod shape-determining protein MreD [Anaerolineales bacterium]|nr:rod shape-determining protein MreD [Anaerolineales bacterium]
MNNFIPPAILISATLLQSTLAPYIKISNVHPDLVLVIVIGWTILRGLRHGVVWAVIGGLSLDLLSGGPFGLFTLAMLVVTLVTSLFHGRLFGSSIILPLSLTFPLSLLFNGLALLLLNLLGRPVVWDEAFSAVLVPVAIFNTAVMLLVFPLLYMLNRWLNPQPLSF